MTNDFEYFKIYYPHIADRVIEFVDVGYGDYIAKCDDGTKVLFNMFNKSYRYLPQTDNLTKDECMIEFGHRLATILVNRHMTQRDLSETTGIQQSLISDYTNGRRLPGFYNLDKIATALGCSTEDFRYIK